MFFRQDILSVFCKYYFNFIFKASHRSPCKAHSGSVQTWKRKYLSRWKRYYKYMTKLGCLTCYRGCLSCAWWTAWGCSWPGCAAPSCQPAQSAEQPNNKKGYFKLMLKIVAVAPIDILVQRNKSLQRAQKGHHFPRLFIITQYWPLHIIYANDIIFSEYLSLIGRRVEVWLDVYVRLICYCRRRHSVLSVVFTSQI